MNGEGYKDPTAEEAVRRADRMPKKIWEVVQMLNKAAGVAGLEITGLKDKKTGNVWMNRN